MESLLCGYPQLLFRFHSECLIFIMGVIVHVKLENSLNTPTLSNQKLSMQGISKEQKSLSASQKTPSKGLKPTSPKYPPAKKLVTRIQIVNKVDDVENYLNRSMSFRRAKCRKCERSRVIVGRTTLSVLRGEEKAYTCFQCANNKNVFGVRLRKACRTVQNTCGVIITLLICLLVVVLLLANIGNKMVEKEFM